MRLLFKSENLREADCPPYCGWALANQLKDGREQKDQPT